MVAFVIRRHFVGKGHKNLEVIWWKLIWISGKSKLYISETTNYDKIYFQFF